MLSPRMTTTGGVILANDLHRQISNPSLRYIIHLNAPGWNVIGSGEPSLPGVAIGHNDRVAWGLTIVGTDQDDLYQEMVNPENQNQVRWQGEWENLRVVVDTILIRGEAPRVVELKYSRHGPIVYEDTENHYAYALRTVLHEPGTAHYMGSLRVDQVQNCREFLEAMDHWKTPSENMICGDVEGNIAWRAAALTPDRGGRWHGRLPVPGTGEYEWRGFREDLPEEYNPDRGWIATANHNIQPEGFRSAHHVQGPALPEIRAARRHPIRQRGVLDRGQHPAAARRLSPRGGRGGCSFCGMDRGRSGGGASTPAPLRVGPRLCRGERCGRGLFHLEPNPRTKPTPTRPFPDQVPPEAVASALRMALDSLSAEQGSDPPEWRWGRSNRVPFEHPLTAAFDLPAVEREGRGGHRLFKWRDVQADHRPHELG